MNDVVIVPTYNRPELLYLCLDALSQCPEAEGKIIRVVHDDHAGIAARSELAHYVVNQFRSRLNIEISFREAHQYPGNSYNVLRAYQQAFFGGFDRVYLVEDDVLVCSDFFRWHDAVHAQTELLCSVGWHCIRRGDVTQTDDPRSYMLSKADYASVGVCWQADKLKYVVEHCIHAYYENTSAYLAQAFPGNRFGNCFTEQDGLIMRLLDKVRLPVAWPHRRRCNHVGWYGYHRVDGRRPGAAGNSASGLFSAVEDVRETIKNGSSSPDVTGDVDHILPAVEWDTLEVTQTFE